MHVDTHREKTMTSILIWIRKPAKLSVSRLVETGEQWKEPETHFLDSWWQMSHNISVWGTFQMLFLLFIGSERLRAGGRGVGTRRAL